MTPGYDAVAALYDTKQGEAVLVVIDADGRPYVRQNIPLRDARQAIDLAVERAAEEIENRTTTTAAKRVRGRWAVSLKCPDGKVRKFVEQQAKPRSERRQVSMRERFSILMRDGFRCRYCGRTAPDVQLVVDHVVPVSGGGSNGAANLVAACVDCNAGKADRRLPEDDRLPYRLPKSEEAA